MRHNNGRFFLVAAAFVAVVTTIGNVSTAVAQELDCLDYKAVAGFKFPLESFQGLAGTYGELRGNHFHCGLDLRTGGSVGKKVYAAEDGYISRMAITPDGFGNMLTLTHPSGYKTIYGHLLSFAEPYHSYLRKRQLASKSWAQSIDIADTVFPVKKGDFIALSGNSGSSGGPHLHFEVLNPEGVPVNLGKAQLFDIEDTKAPIFRDVQFFGAALVLGAYYTYSVPGRAVIQLPYCSYVAIDAYDIMEGSAAKLAVVKYEVKLDTTTIFRFTEGNVPYDKGRDISSMLEPSLKATTGRYYLKSAVDEGNSLRDRIYAPENGYILLKDTLIHRLTILLTDVYGNTAKQSYNVRKNSKLFADKVAMVPKGEFWAWYKEFSHRDIGGGLDFFASKGTLFSSIYLTLDSLPQRATPYSATWQIGDSNIPFKGKCKIAIAASIPQGLENKAVIAKITKREELISVGGKYSMGKLRGEIGYFGAYCVEVDTLAPKATFRFAQGAKLQGNTLKIGIKDDLSGIKKYQVEIDGKWVVAALDGKTSTLSVALSEAALKRGRGHTVTVALGDMVDNESISSRRFVW